MAAKKAALDLAAKQASTRFLKALCLVENFLDQSSAEERTLISTLANVQTQVLAAHQKASKALEKWEREFGFAPTYENYKTEEITRSAHKKKKLSRDLLRNWKITVHLQ